MLKFLTNQIVFQEVPDEISLAFWITNCPGKCVGCHAPFLRQDLGQLLTPQVITEAFIKKHDYITCITFMGGDSDVSYLAELIAFCKNQLKCHTAVYSGLDENPVLWALPELDYLKLGHYNPDLGPLGISNSNQKMFFREKGEWKDITHRFARSL